ncbi:MAG TPA: hypothetical protein DCW50_06080 [Gammaproteobacteria bacterium]|nr:MAG: TlpA family protein disulfide reductase [Proteobacteria bacterium TMED51]HAU41600.1 hypothetical protein [Gammaproteobacteria bacterium]
MGKNPFISMHSIHKVVSIIAIYALVSIGSAMPRVLLADALEYSLQDLQGNVQSLSQYQDQWVIVNFWATWCGPCIREIPELMAFADRHVESVQVVGIAFEKTPIDEIRSFVAELGVTYPVLIIGEEPLVPMEPLKGLPSTFLISPEGQVVHLHVGPVTEDALTEWLARYVSG